MHDELSFNQQLGQRLREARQARGLSLLNVEVNSDGEFKASALGCYERGERAITAHRLARLAKLYGVGGGELFGEQPVSSGGQAPGVMAPAATDGGREGTKTVLVVDDDATVRELVSTTLKLEGFDTVTAADGVMAIEMLTRLRFEAIVLDTVMPRMDGLSVLRTLRSDPATADTPVLVLSGLDDINHLQQAVEAGASGYLTKPFELRSLLEQIQRVTLPSKRGAKP
jgi:two-component system chemotaxis response regulator CheY